MSMFAHCASTPVMYQPMVTQDLGWSPVNHKVERMPRGGTLIRMEVVGKRLNCVDKRLEVFDERVRYIKRIEALQRVRCVKQL